MKLAILDRDGTINKDSTAFIKSPAEWHPLPGALEAITILAHHGWEVVVATNQSGVGRGILSQAALDAIHAKMREALADMGGWLAGIYTCTHAGYRTCACRKPAPGLFLDIAAHFKADLAKAVAVGDSLRDLQAAHAAGVGRNCLVRTGNGNMTELHGGLPPRVEVYHDLAAVARRLVMEGGVE